MIYRKNFIFCTLLFFLFFSYSSAQKNSNDSSASFSKEDTLATNLESRFNYFLTQIDNDSVKAFSNLERIAIQASKQNNKMLKYKIYATLGTRYREKLNYQKNQFFLEKTLEIMKGKDDSTHLFAIYNNLGASKYVQGNITSALEDYFNAIRYCKDKKNIGSTFNNIGLIYKSIDNFSDAEKYFKKALKNNSNNNGYTFIGNTCNNLGELYFQKKDFNDAMIYFLKSFQFYKKINNQEGISDVLLQIGNIYFELKEYNKAIINYKKSLKISNEMKLKIGVHKIQLSIAKYYLAVDSLEKAELHALKAYSLSKSQNYNSALKFSAKTLSNIYNKKKDFTKAYNYLIIYQNENKKNFNEKVLLKTMHLATKYKLEKQKEISNTKLAQQNLLTKEKERANLLQRDVFLLIFALTLLVLIYIYKSLKSNKKLNRKLKKDNLNIKNSFNLLKKLNKSLMKITNQIKINKIFDIAALEINEFIDSDLLLLGLYDTKTKILNFNQNNNNDIKISEFTVDPAYIEPFSTVLKNKKTLILNYTDNNSTNYNEDFSYLNDFLPLPKNITQQITIPLIVGKNHIGILSLHSSSSQILSDRDIDILKNITLYISLALKNALIIQQEYQQQKFLNELIELIPNPIFYKDKNGYYKGCNSAFEKILNLKKENIIGNKLSNILPSTHKEYNSQIAEIEKMNNETMKRKSFYSKELKIMLGDLKYHNIVFYNNTYKDQNMNTDGIIGLMVDITKYKETEKELKIFKLFADTSGLGFGMADLNGSATYLNPKLQKMMGIDKKEYSQNILGTKIEFAYPKNYRKKLIDTIFPTVLKNGQWTGEMKLKANNHKILSTIENYFLVKNDLDEPLFFANVITDITKLKQLEEQLFQSQQRLSSIFSNMAIGVDLVDKTGRFIAINAHFPEMLGYTRNTMSSMSIFEITSNNDMPRTIEHFKELQNGKKVKSYRLEKQMKKKDGTFIWTDLSVTPLYDKNGDFEFEIGVILDISAQKIANQKRIESEKKLQLANDSKDKLFSIIAHDLRGPVSNIAQMLEFLEKGLNKYQLKNDKTTLLGLKNSAKATVALLENLLYWANSQRGSMKFKPELISLDKIVNENIDLLIGMSRNKKIYLINKLSRDEETLIFADKNMVTTIIRNLISNAIKFTSENGKITITTDGIILIKSSKFIKISITDTGKGMPDKIAENIFSIHDIYTTYGTKGEKGTGLGLVLCKEFVEKHNGSINVKSKLDKGSTFSFTLPFVKMQKVLPKMNILQNKKKSFNFLIAEDDTITAMLTKNLLKKKNIKCKILDNGKKVIEEFEQNHKNDYNCVLVDGYMPELNGFDTINQLHKLIINKKIRKIALIALSSDADDNKIRFKNAGADLFIKKPLNENKIEKIIDYLQSKSY